MSFVTIETLSGPVKGLTKTSILGREYLSFTNIPYMEAPIGKLRFREPEEVENWTETLDATRKPENYCGFNPMTMQKSGREDAAFINVYVPCVNNEALLPVMVLVMSSGQDMFGPDYFMQKDVIIVTFNHRFGPIGYLSLNDPELKVPGNAGLKDQVIALKWIQSNMSLFKGNPDNVTLFGNSHGSYSINYLMISDLAKGLFHKAIMQSGSAFCKYYSVVPPKNWTERLVKQHGYDGELNEKTMLEFLESIDPTDLCMSYLANITDTEKYGEKIMTGYGPVIEPYIDNKTFITEDPILMAKKAWSKNMDVIIGANSFEGSVYLYMVSDQTFEVLKNESYYAPLRELSLCVEDEKAKVLGTRIKELYYGQAEPKANDPEPYLHYLSDYGFWHGIHRWIISRLTYGSGKNYFYRFDAVTKLNIFKHVFSKTSHFKGAAHGDEIPHLFKFDSSIYKDSKAPEIDSEEFTTIKRMISLWSSFAINGDPNYNSEVGWQPLESKEFPFNCLNITSTEASFIPFPENDRMLVWNSVFEESNVPMF